MQINILKKISTILLTIPLSMMLLSFCVYAGESYSPYDYSLPIKGNGTFVLESENGAPTPQNDSITVNGSGEWNISFSEPGTFEYKVYNRDNPENVKQVRISIVNSNTDGTLTLIQKETIVYGSDGKKTDLSFPVPNQNNPPAAVKPKSSSRKNHDLPGKKADETKTGDMMNAAELALTALSAACLLIIVCRYKNRSDRIK